MRGHKLEDFDAFAAHWESPRTEYIGGPHDRRRAWEVFSQDAGQWMLRGYGMWILEDKASGKVVGTVGFYEPISYEEAELGWILLEEFEGKGLASEAAQAALEFGAAHFGITAPCSFISAPNARSIALAEKLGATREDTRHSENGAYYMYRHPVRAAADNDGAPEAYA